jgi:GxxExxY protein
MLVDTECNEVSQRIIGCAIEVHRHLGPGLLESAYESALCLELREAGLAFLRQIPVPLRYKGEVIAEHRPDLVVEGAVVVEIKSVERLDPVHIAQVLTYLRVTNLRVGLLLNFNTNLLRSGIRRVLR